MKVFTDYVVEALSRVNAPSSATEFYLKHLSLFNYAVVGSLGVVVNMVVLSTLIGFGVPLLLSDAAAILVAFLGNWALSVGPYGYFMGLKEKPKK